MPNSLKSRLKKLVHQGLLSERDLSRIYTDNDVVKEFEKIKAEILDKVSMYEYDFLIELHFVEEVINKRISELKGENNG